ncbi:MAG: hypothetical protein AB1445_02905 [Bacillota bacterium]
MRTNIPQVLDEGAVVLLCLLLHGEVGSRHPGQAQARQELPKQDAGPGGQPGPQPAGPVPQGYQVPFDDIGVTLFDAGHVLQDPGQVGVTGGTALGQVAPHLQ